MKSSASTRPECLHFLAQCVPFDSADQAWFWACAALAAAREGADRPGDLLSQPRACDPQDIFIIIKRLHRLNRLTAAHLQVLGRYGQEMVAPELSPGRIGRDGHLWQDAMTALAKSLQDKELLA